MVSTSLSGFIDIIGYYDYRSRVLKREYEPARLLREREGGDKAVLFRVVGSEIDAAGNIVDTREKLWKAIGASSDEEAYRKIIENMRGVGEARIWGWPGGYREAERGWLSLPAVKFYERDGGLYLTSGIVVACYDGVCNASIHRIMVVDENDARIRVVPRHLWTLYKRAVEHGEDLPVTIVFGVHPAYLIAAATSTPFGVFELSLGSKLLGDAPLVESPLHGNPIPLDAAVIVEATLTREMGEEGPFADILLLYDKVRMQPKVKPIKIYLNRSEYAHVILSGGLEHVNLMGFPREAMIWESVRRVVPRVKAVRLTPGGGGWLHAVVSIEKGHPGDGKNAIMAAFAGHPSLKHVVIVDSDIDIDDPRMVEWAIATRFQASRDLIVIREARGSTLDPSGEKGMVAKMGLDATIPPGKSREEFEPARIP